MSKFASSTLAAMGGSGRTVVVRVIELSIFGGIVTAMAAGVIRLR